MNIDFWSPGIHGLACKKYCSPFKTPSLGCVSLKIFWPAIQIWWKLHLVVILFTTNFCTYHDITGVMPYTKFCSNHCIKIQVRVKRNFRRIWIAMDKPGPGVRCCFWLKLSSDLTLHKSCLNFWLKSEIRLKSETAPHPRSRCSSHSYSTPVFRVIDAQLARLQLYWLAVNLAACGSWRLKVPLLGPSYHGCLLWVF